MDSFIKTVHLAIRGLDTIIDENLDNHPLKEQRDLSENYRNVGAGVMGLYDMFIKLGIRYGSDESQTIANHIMATMFREAVFASNDLAAKKGTFPLYDDKLFESSIILNHLHQMKSNY